MIIMKYKHIKVSIFDIIPQQHYLSTDKYKSVKDSEVSEDNYGDIFIIEYKGKMFSVDGHHRLFYLFKLGVTDVNVVCELSDNNSKLYQILADESIVLGLSNISDLENRFIDNYDDYKKSWIDKCQKILRDVS